MIMYLTVLVDILIILLLLVGDVVGIIAFLKKIKVVKEKNKYEIINMLKLWIFSLILVIILEIICFYLKNSIGIIDSTSIFYNFLRVISIFFISMWLKLEIHQKCK